MEKEKRLRGSGPTPLPAPDPFAGQEDKIKALIPKITNATTGFEVKNRKFRMKTYRDCFRGDEAVAWLAANEPALCPNREAAAALGQKLVDMGVIGHVVDKKKSFLDGNFFYRFNSDVDSPREETQSVVEEAEYPDILIPFLKDVSERHLTLGGYKKPIKAITLNELVDKFRNDGPEVKDRKYKMKTYPTCFLGSEAVDWLLKYMKEEESKLKFSGKDDKEKWKKALSRGGACQGLQYMMNLYLFKHVTKDKEFEFRDGEIFYDFIDPEAFKVNFMLLETQSERVGEAKFKTGYKPLWPVVIIPGLASSALEAWQTNEKNWQGTRVWIDIPKLGQAAKMQQVKMKFQSAKKLEFLQNSDSELERRERLGRKWTKHVLPLEDGWSDPPGIKIRAVEGLHGVDYLSAGLGKKATYVWGHIIKSLIDVGYDTINLNAAPYDWRIPPEKLEERDAYFTKLKLMVEQSRIINKKRVVMIAHSMGNRNLQYFFEWVIQNYGQSWIDENVEKYLALGAPLLGAPKTFRGMMTGDALGLDFFLVLSEGKQLAAHLGSLPWLRPLLHHEFPDALVRYRDPKAKEMKWEVKNPDDLCKRYLPGPNKIWENFYLNNPYFLGMKDEDELPPVLRPPPIRHTFFVYGINLETETSYYLTMSKKSNFTEPKLDKKADKLAEDPLVNPLGFRIKKGVGYEIPTTRQEKYGVNRSGDGTVPYSSLAYCKKWQAATPPLRMIEVKELGGADHREMMKDPVLINTVLDYVCEAPKEKDK